MSQNMQVVSESWKRQTQSHLEPSENPLDTLILAQYDLFWTFDLQNYKVIYIVLNN